MVKIPEKVDDWSIGTITDLLHEGYDENSILEFKLSVNPEGNRISKTACAFANTNGGFLLIGIDGERKKNYHERIVGIEDSDQLKRQILDHINNIQPQIPTEHLQFRKNNIQLPNGKVIVILQIIRSYLGPHQFEYIFYKRLPDGNSPMGAVEVSSLIINSQKNRSLFNLLMTELGVIRANYERAKISLENKQIDEALTQCGLTTNNSTQHFLYNQAFLYGDDFQNEIRQIVEISLKLSYDINEAYEEAIERKDTPEFKEFIKSNNYQSVEEYMQKFIGGFIELVLTSINEVERISGYNVVEPRNLMDFK